MMSANAAPYRNAENEVTHRAKRLLASQRTVDEKTLGAMYRHRCARAGFGIAGSIGGLFSLIFIAAAEQGQVHALGFAWAIAILGGLVSYVVARRRLARRAKRALAVADDPYSLVIRLTSATKIDEDDQLLDRVERLGLTSHRYPLLFGAMLLPLTLLIGFVALTGGGWSELESFTKLALICTVHVHVYAAIAAWHYPYSRKPLRMVAIATALGVLPFIISGAFVGVIAVVITTCIFMPTSSWVDRENLWIALERQERVCGSTRESGQQIPATPLQDATANAARSTFAAANPL